MGEHALKLKCALGNHAHVHPLVTGAVKSDLLSLEFVECEPLSKAFRQMVREGRFDVSEMAITTHLLALEYGRPLAALPIALWRRFHHDNLVCRADSPLQGPKDLEGRKIGVRAYSQTTGVWIRGILASQYGVDLARITFVTMEDSHLPEFVDPANCVRYSGPKKLRELLLDGELDAIMGERAVNPNHVRPVIADERAGCEWSQRTGIFPVNHIVSVRQEMLERYPWLAGELMRLFEDARAKSGAGTPAYGLETSRKAMQMLMHFAAEQGLTRREWTVDEVFPRY